MNQARIVSLVVWSAIGWVCAFTAWGQTAPLSGSAPKPENSAEAVARLRADYLALDYEGGVRVAKASLARFPENLELRGWFLLSMARYDQANDQGEEAIAEAEKLTAAHPDSPWGWFALAGALSTHPDRGKEALDASEKALAKSPDHPDLIWLHAAVLRRQDHKEAAIALVDKHQAKLKNRADLIVVKAEALYALSLRPERDEGKMAEALTAFAEARAVDPANVSAHYWPGYYLLVRRRFAEAHPLLKKAATLASTSTPVHRDYWRVVMGLSGVSPEQKRAEIEADIKALLERRGASPGALLAIANIYKELTLKEQHREMEDRILQLDATSKEAQWVLVNRYRDFRQEFAAEGFKNPQQKEAYRKMLREFIHRPQHRLARLKGDAYRELFYQIKDDPAVGHGELLEVVHGMVKYEGINPQTVFAGSAIALAERKAYFREAEAIARAGIVEAKKKIDKQRSAYKTQGDYERALNWLTSEMHDALGWIYFHEDRMLEAEKELLFAYNLSPQGRNTLYHLGRYYQAQKDLDKAEEFYIKGALVPMPGESPSVKALKALYEQRRGSLDGYPDYLAKIKDQDAANRKEKALGARIAERKPVMPFKLNTLGGAPVTLADLKGKIVVINFWGLWCGPCVAEMPDIQKLYEKYRSDPQVAILTINNDNNPDKVRQWMQEKNYSFGVLTDTGYVDQANVRSFPTTWFLDPQTQLGFVKVGWSEKVVEEFSWRIEALRQTLAK